MNKRSYVILDINRSSALGLNPTESILASCMYGLLAQSPIQYNGRQYYLADYRNLSEYCAVLPDKVDTLRRLYRRLEEIGLITVVKIDNHICFAPSDLLRDWGTDYEAENNPVESGKKSGEAEKNPSKAEKNPSKAEKNPLSLYIRNNNYNINRNEYEGKQLEIASDVRNDMKTLFRNSNLFNEVKYDNGRPVDYKGFEAHFTGDEFSDVDLVYYYHCVSDWSDQKNVKRTNRGWIATVRNFIRWDAEKGKVHRKSSVQQATFDVNGAMDFLNNNY